MKRRSFLQVGLGLGIGNSAAWALPSLTWRTIHFLGFGTTLSITAAHTNARHLDAALAKARDLVTQIESQMSLFSPSSALSRLNRDGFLLQPPSDLLRILTISQNLSRLSQGAFDVTVQPLWELYAQHHSQGELPSAKAVESTRQYVNWKHLEIKANKVVLNHPHTAVTLNGIAQGYASDRVKETLKQQGIQHALINTGEWSSLGHSPSQQDWILGIADPHQHDALLCRLAMQGACLATSADDEMFFSEDHQHHHIFNPHTGYSPPDISSVTVAAAQCTMADALTKVLFVAGYDKALQMANDWKVSALVVHKSGKTETTAGFPKV